MLTLKSSNCFAVPNHYVSPNHASLRFHLKIFIFTLKINMTNIILNSKFRTNSSSDPGNSQIPLRYASSGQYQIEKCILPRTWYDVTSSNNKIYFTDAAGSHTASLTSGSYTVTNLATEIGTRMTSASGSKTFTCTANNNTMKYTIATGDGSSFTMDMGSSPSSSAGNIIGFTTQTSSMSSLTGDSVFNMNRNLYVNMLIGTQTNYSDQQSALASLVIPINVDFGDFIVYEPNKSYVVNIDNNNQVNIAINNSDGTNATLNGVNFAVVLRKLP